MYFLNYVETIYENFGLFDENDQFVDIPLQIKHLKESKSRTLLLVEIEKNLKEGALPIQIWSFDLIVKYPPHTWNEINHTIMCLVAYLLYFALIEKSMYDTPMPYNVNDFLMKKSENGYYTKSTKRKRAEDKKLKRIRKKAKLNHEKFEIYPRMNVLLRNENVLDQLLSNPESEGLLEMIHGYELKLIELKHLIDENDSRYLLFVEYDPSAVVVTTIDEIDTDENFILKNVNLLVNKLTDIGILIEELQSEEKKEEEGGVDESNESVEIEINNTETGTGDIVEPEPEPVNPSRIFSKIKTIGKYTFILVMVSTFLSFVLNSNYVERGNITQEIVLNFLQQYGGMFGFDWDSMIQHIKPVNMIDNEILGMYLLKFINRLNVNINRGNMIIKGVNIIEIKEIAVKYLEFLTSKN